ncbi:hypothetical protein F5Y18DRAFT_437203 [Xylariaceae sp. FL1019]|nr:hypothetical protein F5Y18DRAFT_437203 [Xylariaceae sp. FL1019]
MADRLPNLKHFMPKNGVKWQDKPHITKDIRRDESIAEALKSTGALNGAGVNRAITQAFEIALPIFKEAQGEWTEDTVAQVRLQLDWGRDLTNTVFWAFFRRIIAARVRWERHRTARDATDHPSSVLAVIAFRQAIETEAYLFPMAYYSVEGIDNDKDDDEETMDDTSSDEEYAKPAETSRLRASVRAGLQQLRAEDTETRRQPQAERLDALEERRLAQDFDDMELDDMDTDDDMEVDDEV